MSLREYEALLAGSAGELKHVMNRLSQEGWKRIRYTLSDSSSYFTVTASRKYRTCTEEGCRARLYRGEVKCPEHVLRWRMEYRDLSARLGDEANCVGPDCWSKYVEGTYCVKHEKEAEANYALKGKASDRTCAYVGCYAQCRGTADYCTEHELIEIIE